MGRHKETIPEVFIWAISFWKRFIDNIFLIFLGTTEQLQSMKDFMNNLHPTIKFTFEHSTQEISFLDMKICIGADRRLSTTLYRKPTNCATLLHFHSNHSLKYKENTVFSQALRYNLLIKDDTLLQKELDSLAISLLARQYPLEIITRNISKALLHSHDTLLCRPPKTTSPKRVLPIVITYFPEGRHFSQSVRNRWHIIENDSQLQNVWPNHSITAYHKTESLKDILVHFRQTKPTSSRSAPKIPLIMATDTFTTDMQPHPSEPHLSMETHLLILATLFATWVPPPTQRPPSLYHCHTLHGLQYHVPPPFSLRTKNTKHTKPHALAHPKKLDILNHVPTFLQKEH